jgi:hypothetical protein
MPEASSASESSYTIIPPVDRTILRCADCGNPAASSGYAGFCRKCGAPLCTVCASNMMTSVDTKTNMVVPLVVVTYVSSTRVEAKVTVCRSCQADYKKINMDAFKTGGKAGLILWLGISLPLIATTGIGAAIAILLIIGALGLMFIFPVYFFLVGRNEKNYRPTCPICGKDAMNMLFRNASSLDSREQEMVNMLWCTCGYQGPRVPFDGLWKFVDNHGPGPLAGSSLEPMANESYRIRKRWKK